MVVVLTSKFFIIFFLHKTVYFYATRGQRRLIILIEKCYSRAETRRGRHIHGFQTARPSNLKFSLLLTYRHGLRLQSAHSCERLLLLLVVFNSIRIVISNCQAYIIIVIIIFIVLTWSSGCRTRTLSLVVQVIRVPLRLGVPEDVLDGRDAHLLLRWRPLRWLPVGLTRQYSLLSLLLLILNLHRLFIIVVCHVG